MGEGYGKRDRAVDAGDGEPGGSDGVRGEGEGEGERVDRYDGRVDDGQ